MRLYHFSNENIKNVLRVKFFGRNGYSKNDVLTCGLKRLYFYKDKKPEAVLSGAKYLYTVNGKGLKLYSLKVDSKRYLLKFGLVDGLKLIKKRFDGVVTGYGFICLFNDIKYHKRILLDETI